MAQKVNASCNWTQVAGNNLSELVPTRLFDSDVFMKPELDDIVDEERAALFSTNDGAASCELEFQVSSCNKIAALSIVCSAPKVECFLGASQEYYETIHGVNIEEDNADIPIESYRYDIEIDRSGITDIRLKLLTSSKEVCVYGAILHIAPNPNGITTDLPWAMDLENVQKLLNVSTNISPTNSDAKAKKIEQLMSLMKGRTVVESSTYHQACGAGDSSSLYTYIDIKFKEFERNIYKRIDDFEAKQTEKLNTIIEMLQNRN